MAAAEKAADAQGKEGKGAMLAARIPAELRAALEAEAAAQGRTISQVALQWMERGRTGQIELEASGAVGETLARMARFAEDLRARAGDPTQSMALRMALVRGWGKVAHTFPAATASEAEQRGARARVALVEASSKLWEALRALAAGDQDHPVIRRFAQRSEARSVNLLLRPEADAREHHSIVDLLHEMATSPHVPANMLMKRLGEALADSADLICSQPQVFRAMAAVQEAAIEEVDAEAAALEEMAAALRISDELVAATVMHPILANIAAREEGKPEPR